MSAHSCPCPSKEFDKERGAKHCYVCIKRQSAKFMRSMLGKDMAATAYVVNRKGHDGKAILLVKKSMLKQRMLK